jgi:hypothetical protein
LVFSAFTNAPLKQIIADIARPPLIFSMAEGRMLDEFTPYVHSSVSTETLNWGLISTQGCWERGITTNKTDVARIPWFQFGSPSLRAAVLAA